MEENESINAETKLYYLPPDLIREYLINGYSIQRGVLIVWDDPREKEIIDLINKLESDVCNQLYVVYGKNNRLQMYWDGNPPFGYEKDEIININDKDWVIQASLFAYLDFV